MYSQINNYELEKIPFKKMSKIKALEANLEQTKAKLKVAVEALEKIKKWDEGKDEEWLDFQGITNSALEKIMKIDGL